MTQLEKPNTAHNSLAQKGARRAQLPLEMCRRTSLDAGLGWLTQGLGGPWPSEVPTSTRSPLPAPAHAPGRRGYLGEPYNLAHISRTCFFCCYGMTESGENELCFELPSLACPGEKFGHGGDAAGGRQGRAAGHTAACRQQPRGWGAKPWEGFSCCPEELESFGGNCSRNCSLRLSLSA